MKEFKEGAQYGKWTVVDNTEGRVVAKNPEGTYCEFEVYTDMKGFQALRKPVISTITRFEKGWKYRSLMTGSPVGIIFLDDTNQAIVRHSDNREDVKEITFEAGCEVIRTPEGKIWLRADTEYTGPKIVKFKIGSRYLYQGYLWVVVVDIDKNDILFQSNTGVTFRDKIYVCNNVQETINVKANEPHTTFEEGKKYHFLFGGSVTVQHRNKDYVQTDRGCWDIKSCSDGYEIMFLQDPKGGVVSKSTEPYTQNTQEDKHHADHYKSLKIQPWEVMEQRTENPGDIPVASLFNIVQSLKYINRAGLKDGEPWKKDIQKAANLLHRALTGEWTE